MCNMNSMSLWRFRCTLLGLLHAVPREACDAAAEHARPCRAPKALARQETAATNDSPERVRCQGARQRRALVALSRGVDVPDEEELPGACQQEKTQTHSPDGCEDEPRRGGIQATDDGARHRSVLPVGVQRQQREFQQDARGEDADEAEDASERRLPDGG